MEARFVGESGSEKFGLVSDNLIFEWKISAFVHY